MEELAELLLSTEIVVEAVELLVELALQEGPDALDAVEGRGYDENNDEMRDDELTIGRLKVNFKALVNQRFFGDPGVVGAVVVEDEMNLDIGHVW